MRRRAVERTLLVVVEGTGSYGAVLTRYSRGVVHARRLDVVPGRLGTASATWLRS